MRFTPPGQPHFGQGNPAFANTAGGELAHSASSFANYTAYSYGWQLFQMPYAVVGISVITALLPRLPGPGQDRASSER